MGFFHKIVDVRDTIYTDQTGKFTCTSKGGHNNLCLRCKCHFSSTFKTRKGKELVDKLSKIHEHLEERGHKPNHHFLDNETSQEMKSYLIGKDKKISICTPSQSSQEYRRTHYQNIQE